MQILELLTSKYKFDLVKQGDIHICYCPFHKDVNRPNLTVYPSTNSYFCYTCSFGGDAVDFLRRMEGITRQEATRRIFDDLQLLIDKINFIPEVRPFNEVVDLMISRRFRDFLQQNPSKLSKVKKIMQEVDGRLVRDVNQIEATSLVSHVNKRLKDL